MSNSSSKKCPSDDRLRLIIDHIKEDLPRDHPLYSEPYLAVEKDMVASIEELLQRRCSVETTVIAAPGATNCGEDSVRLTAESSRPLELLHAAALHAEAVMSIVEPRSDKAEYLQTLSELRAALGRPQLKASAYRCPVTEVACEKNCAPTRCAIASTT